MDFQNSITQIKFMPLINCPECNNQVSDVASTCPKCGFPFKKSLSESKESTNKVKKVGILLGIGIFLMPYLFSWFTLRSGYSKNTKIISFIWLSIFAVIYINQQYNDISTQSAAASTGNSKVIQKEYWRKGIYVDEFERDTEEKFISNKEIILGKFSNTATENSKLGVKLFVNKDTIEIKLYEYNRTSPVKSNILKEYAASYIIDNKKYPEGNISSYTGYLSSDRIRFVDADFYGIKNALESNAKVTFYILEKDRLTTDYTFTIPENNNFKEISSGYFN